MRQLTLPMCRRLSTLIIHLHTVKPAQHMSPLLHLIILLVDLAILDATYHMKMVAASILSQHRLSLQAALFSRAAISCYVMIL